MSIENLIIVNQIKSCINAQYPFLNINSFYDPIYNDLEIGITDKEIYYSDKYQKLITNINIEYLWPKNIMNVLFIYDTNFDYLSNFKFAEASVSDSQAVQWNYEQSSFDTHDDPFNNDDYAKAA